MIEVRIDISWMQKHQHNIMHSILMMQALRAAGMPVIGKIIFNGPERGQLIQWRENDLDGDDWVVEWWPVPQRYVKGPVHSSGSGKGFKWVRYAEPGEVIPPKEADW